MSSFYVYVSKYIFIYIYTCVHASKLYTLKQLDYFPPPQMGFCLFESPLEVREHQQAKPPVDSSSLDLERGSAEPTPAPVAVYADVSETLTSK